MAYDIKVCRCCGRYVDRDDAIKYSTRHYAHVRCYFDAGKPASRLALWVLKKIVREHTIPDVTIEREIHSLIAQHERVLEKAREHRL